MRTMITLRIPVETGNRTIKDGSLPPVIQQTMEKIKPESAYCYLENGRRTLRAVFDLKDANDMVAAFEPVMMALNAELELVPVMTVEELGAGFAKMG